MLLMLVPTGASAERTLVLTGPADGLLMVPVYRMMDTDALTTYGVTIEYEPWKTPQQLTAKIASGSADLAAMPVNLAANFHNRGISCRMVLISGWRVLWVLAAEPGIDGFEDLKDREIAVPFKDSLPDLLFREGLKRHFLAAGDIRIRRVATSLDAAQLLTGGGVDIAVVAEPKCSLALHQSTESDRPLYRSFDLQGEGGLPMAGFAAFGELAEDQAFLMAFYDAYGEAAAWCETHPDAAGQLAARRLEGFPAEAIADGIRSAGLRVEAAGDIHEYIEAFLEILSTDNLDRIGGRLPGEDFYWNPDS